MKKIIAFGFFAVAAIAACRKTEDTKSLAYSPSYPVVTITSDTFYTIQVGGALPANVAATAYDTFYKKSLDSMVVIDYSAVDITTPGLYKVTASAKNQIGYVCYAYAYINVVSSVSTLVNFAGRYMQTTNGDTVWVTSKMSQAGGIIPGFYSVNNVAGVHSSYDSVNYITPAFFAQQSNSQITMPTQITSLGNVTGAGAWCIVASADTAFGYQVINADFGPSFRTFKRF